MNRSIARAHRERHCIARENHHRQIIDAFGAVDELHVCRIKLSIAHFGFKIDRPRCVIGHMQDKMRDITRAWRDLIVVEREKDVLRVAAIDAVAFTINDECVECARPRIKRAVVAERADGAEFSRTIL